MAMTAFFTKFPDLAVKETRVATLNDYPGLPNGQYGFIELYCDDPACDCRRVVINVIDSSPASEVWATINYGWETPEYYKKWMGGEELASTMLGATLDPLNRQTVYSSAFLQLFKSILSDPVYVERLKRHYEQFKASLPKKKMPQIMQKRKLQKQKHKKARQRK